MNRVSTIKPSGISERTNAVAGANTTNDTLWSDTTATWSDISVMWSVAKFSTSALAPQGVIKSIKP